MSGEKDSEVVLVDQPDTASAVVVMRRTILRRWHLQQMQETLQAESELLISKSVQETQDAPKITEVQFLGRVEFVERAQSPAVSSNLVRIPPGGRIVAGFRFLLSKRKFEMLVQQSVADMREEYFEALAAGETRRAKWVWFRGICSLWAAVAMDFPLSVSRPAVKIWKASQ